MKRRSKTEWIALFDARRQSGQTAAEFCRRHDICPKYFSLRQQQLGWRDGKAFVAVTRGASGTEAALSTGAAPRIELRYGRCLVSLPADMASTYLAELIKRLG